MQIHHLPPACKLYWLQNIILTDMTNLKGRPLYLGLISLTMATGTITGPTVGGQQLQLEMERLGQPAHHRGGILHIRILPPSPNYPPFALHQTTPTRHPWHGSILYRCCCCSSTPEFGSSIVFLVCVEFYCSSYNRNNSARCIWILRATPFFKNPEIRT